MSTDSAAVETAAPAGLKKGAIGMVAVIFMAVANAAPITAMTGNVPIAVGFGNGLGAPAGFLFATIALTLFALGYVAMARHITTTGAFYGFISHGLGQVWGMASGFLATFAYVVFEGSLIGGCAYFANDGVNTIAGVDIPWLVFAVAAVVAIAALCHFHISLTAAILGVTLVSEVLILLALAFTVIFSGGGPDGFMLDKTVLLNNAFTSLPEGAFGTAAAAGSMAIGLFFAFWSWVGFETTAVYGEESRNPKKIIPRATLIAVIGLGLFYTFISAMVLAGNGAKASVEASISASPLDLFFNLVDANLGGFLLDVYKILLVIGSFACALAFHNAASRYLFALGREIPSDKVKSTLGAAHPRHGSPYIASAVQALITMVIVLLFFGFTAVQVPDATGVPVDTPSLVPYTNIYGLLALIGTAAILLVQAICSVAVVWYFWVRKTHRGNVLTTLVCPVLGALAMGYVVWLLWDNRAFAAGYAANSLVFKNAPFFIAGVFLVGLGYALWLRRARPEVYAEIGRTVMEDSHERS
ncbi:APC family permease [Mycolicibacterium vanbaalenii]|uniref:Amino acid/polyamine/organocation transporter, APC superfamily n=2 Tax=Mycolicibacterium vanbaalenii TaxID=110539 RepID=A1T6U3_MYCVP|nr:APC family permease [Mycolicibacterium vanbaalenii]ABM12893.1 amino acid/polyamine/organocation transporter, APC superfamily [Mycolicibacterium vanbaalenii PYR-1]MCV7128175.1 APC family permease [Mycolicibacterium vanbaalenii PYR-1]